jgi:hypothetical protein
MKQFLLEYSGPQFFGAFNLGDEIQSIAAARLVPHHDGYLCRESLDTVKDAGIVILNGFFMISDNHWPPAPSLTPVFYAFHIAPTAERVICSPPGIAYLKEHEPIGCRDVGTVSLLERYGVEAYYSKCLSLTFERRRESPRSGKTYLVGVNKAGLSVIPRALRKRAIKVQQDWVCLPGIHPATKFELARQVLEAYRNTASLVITSKIHCAMPCLAMGIPVVFLWDKRKRDDYRVKIIDDLIGINYVPGTWLDRAVLNRARPDRIDWSPEPIEMEVEKKQIIDGFYQALETAKARHVAKNPSEISD